MEIPCNWTSMPLTNISPVSGMSFFLWSFWLVECHRAPNSTGYLLWFWLPSDSIAEYIAYLSHRTRGNQNQAGRNFIPLASSHSARRYHACYQGRKVIINHSPVWIPAVKIRTGLAGNSGVSITGVTNPILTRSKAAPQNDAYTWHHYWTKNPCLDRS